MFFMRLSDNIYIKVSFKKNMGVEKHYGNRIDYIFRTRIRT